MKANRALLIVQTVLLCAILFVFVVGCSPIVAPVAPPSDGVSLPSMPLQSPEQYERDNALTVLQQLGADADPDIADIANRAAEELVSEPAVPRTTSIVTSTIYDRIVNAIPTVRWPTVGVVLHDNGTGYYQTWCTATLIGCDTVLTAAHCIDHNPQPQQLKVFFQNAGTVNVTEIRRHPDFVFPNADVATLRLEQPVDGIRPDPINYNEPVEVAVTGTIVGFGRSGGARADYGLKRYGRIITASCSGNFSDENLICWNFLAPIGPAGEDSNTCNADSGGPLFSPSGSGGTHLSGVTSGGTRSDCLSGDHSYDARVSRYSDWIVANSGILGADHCGELPSVYEPAVTVQAGYDTLGTTMLQGSHSFEVAPGTQLLRVTLNGEDPGINNFNLYVRFATAPDRTTFDCASTNRWQYESCEIENPAPGQWFALVDRVSGVGSYQVVATVFGADQ